MSATSNIKNNLSKNKRLATVQVLFYDLDSKNVVKEVNSLEFLFIILIILLDQISKYVAMMKLAPINSIEIINGILSFTYVENRGAAFGIFRGKKFYLIGITSVVIILMIYYLVKNKT
ncbi:signal peptidase II [Fervidicella metallireducens]|uniref:signal peptidase II n=1 Tax=Fervidicella metallireducens TaxID=655338 RepID=UPI000ACD7E46|nr:signal peptidase II [Fervidicella metallireducens]